MIPFRFALLPLAGLLAANLLAQSHTNLRGANRLTYLDAHDPFYVNGDFPKLTTPQWVGEPGVEAVVILAIDDLRAPEKYEAMLRPIIDRLKQIDGRTPVSIMCNTLDPARPEYAAWLKEGLSLEVHTLTHPCPLLAKGDFAAADATYQDCIALLHRIAGNQPVAFRMPCCDSMNSPSPRFYWEMFNRTNAAGQFLAIDSSVMNIPTPKDKTLPRTLVVDADGREKFRKYLPFPSFVTTIEDYPYPYVIGRLCWEFPAMVPSDWEAQHIHGVNNPVTVEDWKAALDATVLKQGAFTFIFHPHGWIRAEQMAEFVDYAAIKYGRKVKFLNFREAQERLNRHLLAGQPLRAIDGSDNGVRLVDLNSDGYLDVVIGNEQVRRTRVWEPQQKQWSDGGFPTLAPGAQFGVMQENGRPTILRNAKEGPRGAWEFADATWVAKPELLDGLELDNGPVLTAAAGKDRGVRFRDVNNDGLCELLVGNEKQNAVFGWSSAQKRWKKLGFGLPEGAALVDGAGMEAGLRFVDVNNDGYDDVIYSNPQRFGLHLFLPNPDRRLGWETGWTQEIISGEQGAPEALPLVSRGGAHPNNGVWFHSRHMWIQNEDTAELPDKVDRRSFSELLAGGQPPPKSPADSLAAIEVRPGFKVELVVSEPLVEDPIAFEWGADGRLWVVEMRDYPLGLDGQGQPGGRVRSLEDVDGDGRYDNSTLFLDGIGFPSGLMPWGRGVLIAAAPEIFFAEDTDGDGKADARKILFTGFKEGNQQHRLNGFEYGLDNWLYGANGDSGGRVQAVAALDAEASPRTTTPVDIRGRDFRFRPGEGLFEAQAGQTQYGRHRDDWGNWFGNNNPTWVWHYWIPEQYLERNRTLGVKSTRQVLANYPDSGRMFPASHPQRRFNFPGAINYVTSANSPTPYRDDLFGPDFATSLFISAPVHNVVHREVLEPDGISFKSHRAADEKDREFLASADNWFRPTMLKTGPDGALYIADMYRLVLEHPEWIPRPMQQLYDLRAGADLGRIYRVYPDGATPRKIPRLDTLGVEELAASLDSVNGWQRDTVQRLLVEKRDAKAIPVLEKIAAASARPKARLQALCTLDGLQALKAEALKGGLQDEQPLVRAQAVRLCESRLSDAPVLDLVLERAEDADIRVRYQVALSLGECKDPRAGAALARMALRDKDDPRLQIAIMSSAPAHIGPMLTALLRDNAAAATVSAVLEQLLGLATAVNDERAVARALEEVVKNRPPEPWQFNALSAFLEALDRRKMTLDQFQEKAGAPVRGAVGRFQELFASSRKMAADTSAPEPLRVAAVHLLGRDAAKRSADIAQLADLLHPQNSQAVQRAALESLARSRYLDVANAVLEDWDQQSPATRLEVMNLLLSRPEWTAALLLRIESGKISPSQIGALPRQTLLKHAQPSVRARAQKLFSAANPDRSRVLKEYDGAAQLRGDPKRGAALFNMNCTPCHRLNNQGTELGPNLAALSDKSFPNLLVAILDPNQAVEAPFVSYTVGTADGRELSGVIASETGNGVTLRSAGGKEELVLRSDIKELTSSGLSMMPEGFEAALPPQAMADLIAYITAAPAP